MKYKTLRRWMPLLILIVLLLLFWNLGLGHYLTFSALREYKTTLLTWSQHHFYLASLIFMAFYTISVAVSFPGAAFLTLAGGFLFGIIWGSILVIFSATLGATLLFFAVQTAFSDILSKRAAGWIARMRNGFQENSFSYLLTLRLIPVFPFWVINIVPALLGVRAKTFILATFIGIIPGSVVYVMVGNGLGDIFVADQTPNLGIIFDRKILIPLLILAAFSLLPIFYKKFFLDKKVPHQKNSSLCDLAIIGAGAAGLSLAAGSAQLGLSVMLIESNKMGGDCLNYGCIPSKSLLAVAKTFYHARHSNDLGIDAKKVHINFLQVMQYVQQVIGNISKNDAVERFESLGVEVIQAAGHFLGPDSFQLKDKIIRAKRFVIATGSSPFIPPIPGLDKVAFLTNETIFNLQEQPKHLMIIGGGPIGCELAQAFAMLESQVTILENFKILPKDDTDCVAIIRSQLELMGIVIHEQIQIQSIESHADATISIHFDTQGNSQTITGTHLLIAAGRRANVDGLGLENAKVHCSTKGINTNARLQTSNKKIYAIGDVTGPYQFTHMASYQAGIVLRNIVFKMPAKINYHTVPWVTYTEPELAHVGMLSDELLKNPDLQIIECAFADIDRAQTDHKLQGKIKVITDKKARIKGVTIVGAHAGELILPWVIAIRENKSLRSFTDVIAPYPTFSEISKRVAGEFYKPLLFSAKTRWLVCWLKKIVP